MIASMGAEEMQTKMETDCALAMLGIVGRALDSSKSTLFPANIMSCRFNPVYGNSDADTSLSESAGLVLRFSGEAEDDRAKVERFRTAIVNTLQEPCLNFKNGEVQVSKVYPLEDSGGKRGYTIRITPKTAHEILGCGVSQDAFEHSLKAVIWHINDQYGQRSQAGRQVTVCSPASSRG